MAEDRSQAAGAALLAAVALAACHAQPLMPAAFDLAAAPASLVRPAALDWASHRIGGRTLKQKRDAYFKTLAFPSASTHWSTSGAAGVPLATYGIPDDDVPNGIAVTLPESGGNLANKLFFLTRSGRLLRVDRSAPGTFARWDAPAGKTFKRTFVSLSPKASRAYVYSDDGTLYVVNTLTMTSVATMVVGGGGYGCAPWIDPYRSRQDDMQEEVWVTNNAGQLFHYTVKGGTDGAVSDVSDAVSFNVATGVTPLFGGARKVQAPPVVIEGVAYVGDMAGNFYAYDTTNSANNVTFRLGAPVTSAPAIEVQGGTYALTDPDGNAKIVAENQPVYAFVSAGADCCWLNLHDQSITRSLSLRIDDNDNGRKFGYLRDYNYATSGTTSYLAAQDGGNLNTQTPETALPGHAPHAWSNDVICPAETNTGEAGGDATGGPIVSFLRWYSSTAVAAGQVISSATLTLSPTADQPCRVPDIRSTSAYYRGGTGPWVSSKLTTANMPAIGDAAVGSYDSGGIDGAGNVSFRAGKRYAWDVTSAFAAPAPDGRYALALKYAAGGDAVLWPWGPIGVGKKARRAPQVEGVQFHNNPLDADPAAGTSTDTRPLLTLVVSKAAMPTATIESPPVIDSESHKCYVFYMNTVFELDWSSRAAFTDTDSATKTTLFNLAYYGDTANTAVGVGGTKPGAAYDNRSKLVGNFTAPAPAADLTALYVMSRTPTADGAAPTSWNYALSKIALPLSATSNRMAAGSPTFTGLTGQAAVSNAAGDREASAFLCVDPISGSNHVYFGLSDGRLYQYDN